MLPPNIRRCKPDLVFYTVIAKNDTHKINDNITLFNIEISLLNKLKNKIGTGMANGFTTIAGEENKIMFMQELYTLYLPKGTLTLTIAFTNKTNQNGVLNRTTEPYVFRITSGTDDYTYKNGFIIVKPINDTTGLARLYFTKQ